jgi:hypothetical protein
MRHQQLFDILANVRMQRYYDTELDACACQTSR